MVDDEPGLREMVPATTKPKVHGLGMYKISLLSVTVSSRATNGVAIASVIVVVGNPSAKEGVSDAYKARGSMLVLLEYSLRPVPHIVEV